MSAVITEIAHYVPPDVYTNKWFEDKFDTNDEWIRSRTGIVERHFLKEGATSDLIVPAIRQILERKNFRPEDIDALIVATVSPDNLFPSTAATVQMKLGLTNAWGWDLSAACSGFIYALVTGAALVNSGAAKRVLVAGADKMSSILNFKDRSTAILFGDGAGVALLEHSEDKNIGVVDHILRMDGNGGKFLYMPAGGSQCPPSHESIDNDMHYVIQDGQTVFKAAVVGMAEVSAQIMERNNLTADDVAWLVPHQANLRIIDATARRMGLPKEKVMINIDRYGNTTAGTIPICLSELHDKKILNYGDNLVLASFGAGYTWGSVLLKWGIRY